MNRVDRESVFEVYTLTYTGESDFVTLLGSEMLKLARHRSREIWKSPDRVSLQRCVTYLAENKKYVRVTRLIRVPYSSPARFEPKGKSLRRGEM